MTFHVGQKVVCIDDRYTNITGKQELTKDIVYTVRWCGLYDHPRRGTRLCVRVEGITRPADPVEFPDHPDVPFGAFRFRPAVENKTDISIFTKMLTPKIREREDIGT